MKPVAEIIEEIDKYQDIIRLLEKNNNANIPAEYKKSLMNLKENQGELEKLKSVYSKDYTPVFKDKESKKNILYLNIAKIAGLIKVYAQTIRKDKIDKKLDFLNKDMEDVSDKKMIKYGQKTLKIANKLGGYSLSYFNYITPKKLKKKLDRATDLAHNYGLTAEMIKQLEDTTLSFMKSKIAVNAILKEKLKTIKKIAKLVNMNEWILETKIEKLINIYDRKDSNLMDQYYHIREQKVNEKSNV